MSTFLFLPKSPVFFTNRLYAVQLCVVYSILCAINRKVAGPNPDGIVGTFHWHNPSGRTMAPGSTQPLANEYQEYFLEGKGGRCV